jgi:hypothetical protein
VLPCRHEDILKVGLSRDPLTRLRTLHARYFEFFDLGQSLLVATESLREARALERELFCEAQLHHAPGPLVVPQAAGGHTEWYRGAYSLVRAAALHAAATAGYCVHYPLTGWLQQRLRSEAGSLYEATAALLRVIEAARAYEAPAPGAEGQLRDLLDAYEASDLDMRAHVAPAVLAWYRALQRPRPTFARHTDQLS